VQKQEQDEKKRRIVHFTSLSCAPFIPSIHLIYFLFDNTKVFQKKKLFLSGEATKKLKMKMKKSSRSKRKALHRESFSIRSFVRLAC